MSIKCKKSQLCDIIKRQQPLVSLPTYICSRFEDRCRIAKMSTIINDEWKKPIHDFQGPVSIFLILVFKDYNGSVKWKKWKTKLHSSQCLACTGFDLPESPPICCVLQASEINTLVRLGNYRPPRAFFPFRTQQPMCDFSFPGFTPTKPKRNIKLRQVRGSQEAVRVCGAQITTATLWSVY